ncbi:MAG: YigZ family protein [Desulfobacterales bacterium]|nr:YigZ family protein [Desulfobacterales bacterium]MCP4162478.1 YigZ family protein [Deltaproteobacteria bacterium]
MYKIPENSYRYEETIKRSRFITTVIHAPTEKEAKTFIAEMKNEFSDASHNCWAYVAGPPGDTNKIGMNDDGEPHGTAGKPILNVLLHSDIGEIAVVVTRYFGGTKLGTGGLVRAYSGSVKNTLSKLLTKVKRDTIFITAVLDYANLTAVKRIIESYDAKIINEKFEAEVCLEIELPKQDKVSFENTVKNITSGRIQLTENL